MKILRKIVCLSSLLAFPLLTGCAAGAATAGYSLRAKEADCLSAEGEQRIVNRVKREIVDEYFERKLPPCEYQNQTTW